MNTTTVVGNLKTLLTNLTWTSSGTGTTSFNAVFSYPNWEHSQGYPYVVIDDLGATGESLSNKSIRADNTIRFWIVVNWAVINKTTDDEKREEAVLRIREATDAVKALMVKDTTRSSLGVDHTFDFGWGEILVEDEINILRREFKFSIVEQICR